MSCKLFQYKVDRILLDACFIARLRQLDPSCELIEFFGESIGGATCVIEDEQYGRAPCNHYNAPCEKLADIFSHETAMMEGKKAVQDGIDFTRITRDPADVVIFLWARWSENGAVWTADKNLLKLLKEHDLPRCCFKAAVKMLNDWLNGGLSTDPSYNFESMQTGDDPFYHFSANGRCRSHCGLMTSCPCHGR